jgi:hypothetical protein
MALVFTEEQNILMDSLNRYFENNCVLDSVQRRSSDVSDWNPGLWKGLADELGVLGLTFSEDRGGLGGGAVETMIVMDAIGRHLVIEPFLETIVIGGEILRRSGGAVANALIEKVIGGDARIAFAHAEFQARYCLHDVRLEARAVGNSYVLNGRKTVISGAPLATHYIVSARTGGGPRDVEGISLFLVDASADGVRRRDYRTIDWRPASDMVFENLSVPRSALLGDLDAALPLIETAVDLATVAICAEGAAVLRKIQGDTVDYTKQRQQFGAPLSSFQALRHRMVDMYISVEEATAMSRETCRDWGERLLDPTERALSASALKVCVGRACGFVGESGVQLHGGMGITDDLAVSHYFKRSKVIEQAFGSVDHHIARFEACAFGSDIERVA